MQKKRGKNSLLYGALAQWFHLLTAPSEYRHEATCYAKIIRKASAFPVRTVLELGSGGGNNASHLKKFFRMTLTDVSKRMLALSRRLNPECEHIVADMRRLRLRRKFDAVFVHDAICYMTTKRDLVAAMRTASVHCRRGGIALFAPDDFRETFRERTTHGGHNADGRALRYLEWIHDDDPRDTHYEVDYAYLLRHNGKVTVKHDRHVAGLFSRQDWIDGLRSVGFTVVRIARPPGCSHVFVTRKN